MITGSVTSEMEAIVLLELLDSSASSHTMPAVIDTGFNGFLTLPLSAIETLGCPWLCFQEGILADGKTQIFDVYSVPIKWDGRTRTIEVERAEGTPLVGMELMRGQELRMHVVPQGVVSLSSPE